MKKILFVLILSIPLIASAQSTRFTVIAEPQFSWMVTDIDSIHGEGLVTGLNAGMLIDFFFADNYAFSTGISISNLGGKLSYPDSLVFRAGRYDKTIPGGSVLTYKLQYISIPLGLKFKTNEIGYTTYYANLGLNPMINIKSRLSDSEGITNTDDIKEDINLFNMNYFIHAGVEYSLGGSTAIIGGLGFSSGFIDVTNRASDKININTLTVRVGVLF